MKHLWLALAALLGLASQVAPAAADIQYTLNCSAAPCTTTGNYGTVTVHQTDSTHVQVTVQLAAGEHFVSTGAGVAIAWNITANGTADPALNNVVVDSTKTPNSGNFTVKDFSAGQGYKASPFTSGANGHDFNYAIDYTGPNNGTDNKLVFDITFNSAVDITKNIFVGNQTYRFATDIYGGPCNPTCDVAAKGDGVTVPEPGTLPLSIAGLVGLAGFAMLHRRRKLVHAA